MARCTNSRGLGALRARGKLGLVAHHVPLYTELIANVRPREVHDWIVFAKQTSTTPVADAPH